MDPRVNTLRPRRNEQHFADIFKRIFFNENVWISIKISLNFVPNGPINNIPALVQIMAWRRSGDKPLSEPKMVSLPTHICVTLPQWVKDKTVSLFYLKNGNPHTWERQSLYWARAQVPFFCHVCHFLWINHLLFGKGIIIQKRFSKVSLDQLQEHFHCKCRFYWRYVSIATVVCCLQTRRHMVSVN